jgi:hypothetical protein
VYVLGPFALVLSREFFCQILEPFSTQMERRQGILTYKSVGHKMYDIEEDGVILNFILQHPIVFVL